MFIPPWLLVVLVVALLLSVAWTCLLASGRNPLPFPDHGSRIFAAASPQAKDAIVELLALHGLKTRFEFNSADVRRSILWDGTIINHSSAAITARLGSATSSIGLVSDNPPASARQAARFLQDRGFEARIVPDAEPELPIVFVVTNAMPGTVLNFRRHVIHLPRPQSPGGVRAGGSFHPKPLSGRPDPGVMPTAQQSHMSLSRLVPMQPVRSMPDSVAFYEKLGFSVESRNDEWGWARLRCGDCQLMLDQSIHRHAGIPRISVLYLYPDNVVDFHRHARENGLPVPDLGDTFYGMTEFRLEDPDGNRLWIGQDRRTASDA